MNGIKVFIFLSILLLSCKLCHAQDTILLRNNKTVLARIIEISPSTVQYKKFNFEDGPLYVQNKSEIKAIHYKNGVKDEFKEEAAPEVYDYVLRPANTPPANYDPKIHSRGTFFYYQGLPLSERELHMKIYETKDPKMIELIHKSQRAKGFQYIGFLAIPAGISAYGFLAIGMQKTYNASSRTYAANPNQNLYYSLVVVCSAITIACPIQSSLSKIKRSNYNIQAAALYNQRFDR